MISQVAKAETGGQIHQIGRYLDYRQYTSVTEMRIDSPDPTGMLPVWSIRAGELVELFGRDRELEALTAFFDPARSGGRTALLTGTGPLNGLGRTALAWHYADSALRAGVYPGGAHYLSLADPVAPESRVDPVRALPALLALIGDPPDKISPFGNQQWARYQEYQNRDVSADEARMLLILDDVSDSGQITALQPQGRHHLIVVPRLPLTQNQLPAGEVTVGPLDAAAAEAVLRQSAGLGQEPLFADLRSRSAVERLAWIAAGLPKVLDLLGRYLAHHRDRDLADLARGLAAAMDALPEATAGLGPELDRAARTIGEPDVPVELMGRRSAAQWITEDWRAARPGRWEIEGQSGAGKTTLFTTMARQMRQHEGVVVLLSAKTLLEKTTSGGLSAAKQAVEQAAEQAQTQAAAETAGGAAGGDPEAADLLARYQSPDMLMFCRAVLNGIAEDVRKLLPALAQDLENLAVRDDESPGELRSLAEGALRSALADGRQKFAFFVDNADELPEGPLRDWLLDLATGIGCPVAVTVHTDARSAIQAATRLPLLPLTSPQVRRMAVSTTGRPLLDERQADRITEVTNGLLAYVASALEPIRDDPSSVEEILRLYDRGDGDIGLGIEAAHLRNVQRRFDALARKWLNRPEADVNLFDFMALLRTFDQKTLVDVLVQAQGTDDREPVDRLVEELFGGSAVLIDEDSADGLRRMHELTAAPGRRGLAARNPALHERLHRQISEVLFERLDEWEPSKAHMKQEASWVKFEDPVWTAMAGEWFYHVAMSSQHRIDEQVRLEMSLLYFRALWWYGWFAPLPLCDQIPEEAKALTAQRRSPSDRDWAKALAQVQEGYPHTWRKAEGVYGNWQRAADGLLRLLRLMPEPMPGEEGKPAAELQMYLNVFLADCAHYKPGSTPRSNLEYLADARRYAKHAFKDDEDSEWNFPWFDLFDTETALDLGDLDRAERAMASVMRLHPDSVDTDLRCRFMMAASRLACGRGDRENGVRLGANAVMRCYIYHVEQETTDQAPSQYTTNLHEEALATFEAALSAVHQDSDAYAGSVEWVVDYFAPYWRDSAPDRHADADADSDSDSDSDSDTNAAAMSPAEVIERYLPQPPTSGDLIRVEGDYAERAKAIQEHVEKELEWPPLMEWRRPPTGRMRRLLRSLTSRR